MAAPACSNGSERRGGTADAGQGARGRRVCTRIPARVASVISTSSSQTRPRLQRSCSRPASGDGRLRASTSGSITASVVLAGPAAARSRSTERQVDRRLRPAAGGRAIRTAARAKRGRLAFWRRRRHHALLLTAHAWAHRAAFAPTRSDRHRRGRPEAEPGEIQGSARLGDPARLGHHRACPGCRPRRRARPPRVTIWARHSIPHESRPCSSPMSRTGYAPVGLPTAARSPPRAARRCRSGSEADEGWPAKLARTRVALTNAFVRKSKHDEALEATRGGP